MSTKIDALQEAIAQCQFYGDKAVAAKADSELSALEAERDALKERLTGMNASVDRLEREVIMAKNERDELKARVTDLERERDRLNEACARWSDRHERLEGTLPQERDSAWDAAIEAAAKIHDDDAAKIEARYQASKATPGGADSFDLWNWYSGAKGNAESAAKRIRALKRGGK